MPFLSGQGAGSGVKGFERERLEKGGRPQHTPRLRLKKNTNPAIPYPARLAPIPGVRL